MAGSLMSFNCRFFEGFFLIAQGTQKKVRHCIFSSYPDEQNKKG
jgi:hypothetical protein